MKPMNILNLQLEKQINTDILTPILETNFNSVIRKTPAIIDALIANIPIHRRSSYGRVYAIKILSQHLFSKLSTGQIALLEIASELFMRTEESRSKGVWLGVLSHYGEEKYQPVLPIFQAAAVSTDWEIREYAQMFFRKLIKQHPAVIQQFLLNLVNSEDPNIRRFVAETLRPVQENQWFYTEPEYPLRVLRHLFSEVVRYPRTAVGNNLSDLARRLPNLVYTLVGELVATNDKNSYWIAYRACRNLVKKDPVKVMKLLGVDEYRYKTQEYHLSDYEEST
jgi:3-methyladenine DNA glycosylase AlkC